MKKTALAFCLLLLTILFFLPARAAEGVERVPVRFHDEVSMRYGEETLSRVVKVTLNESPMEFDVPAVIRTMDGVDGRTMVPIRPIAEALGASVLWVAENRQVVISKGEDTVVLTLGSATAVVNGVPHELPGDVPADVAKYEEAERTMVPLRFVSEQLHAQVDWDNDTFTALVTAQLPAEPDPEPEPVPPMEKNPLAGLLLRVTPDDKAETITLYLSAMPRYRVEDLGDRVVIDLLGFAIGSGRDGSMRVENPAITAIRYAQHTDDIYPEESYSTRVVLDLAQGYTFGQDVTVTGDPNAYAVVITVAPPSPGRLEEPEEPWQPPEGWDPTAFTVVLDAGHGGSASGATYEDYMEKNLTLPMTLRAAELLREKGYNVLLTREEDVYMDLYDRCDVANEAGADIFVSIHCNASSTNREFEGTFTYHWEGSEAGERLARCVQSAVVAETGSIDRGLLTNNYVVLRETWMPACLLETGFMSAHNELMKLVTPEYQEAISQGVAKGVETYLSTLPEKTAQPEEEPEEGELPTEREAPEEITPKETEEPAETEGPEETGLTEEPAEEPISSETP